MNGSHGVVIYKCILVCFFVIIIFMCMLICVSGFHVCADACGEEKRALGLLELQLQAVVSHGL